MSSSELNLVEALFETDLHKLRRTFESEDTKGVPLTTFIWILSTTVPALRTVISTFSTKHESDFGKRRRQLAERVAVIEGASASSSRLFHHSLTSTSTTIHPTATSLYQPTTFQKSAKRRHVSPLPYATTEPEELSFTATEKERGKVMRATLESLFVAMDVDGDGCVTWDELYSYTVSTTMHRLTVKPADVVRLYGVSKQLSRNDNIVCSRYFEGLNSIAISSRHESIELLDATSLRVNARANKLTQFDREAFIKPAANPLLSSSASDNPALFDPVTQQHQQQMQQNDFGASNFAGGVGATGDAHHLTSTPTILKMCYVESSGVIVGAADNLRLYLYNVLNGGDPAMIIRGKKIPSTQYRLSPICSEPVSHRVTQLRTAASAPQLAFASLSSGELSSYEVFDAHRPRLRYQFPLHDPGSSILDFAFMTPTEHKVISTSFDRTVRVTDLHLLGEGHPECFWVVGEPEHACTHLTYCESYELIVTASVDCQVRAWTCHATRRPATLLFDSSNPHQERIVGLFHVKNTPQLISASADGLVKVWDLRMFRCAQSMTVGAKENEVIDEAEIQSKGGISRSSMAAMLGEQQLSKNLALNDICYVEGKESFACVGPAKVSLHKYDAGANPNRATESFVVSAQIVADQNTIVMATPQELTSWEMQTGSINATVSDPRWARDDFSCLVADQTDRRVIAGTRCGKIMIWSSVGLNRIQQSVIQPHYSTASSRKEQTQEREKGKDRNSNNNNNNKTKDNRSRSNSPTASSRKHASVVGVTGVGFCAAQNTIVSIGTDGFMQIQRLESNTASLSANRYLLGSGIPLCALSVSDACAAIACGDDSGNLFLCDALVVSGQPVLFRTTLSASISTTVFCGSFPMVGVATIDGWIYIYAIRPAPDGLLLAKWNVLSSSSSSSSQFRNNNRSNSNISRSLRQNMTAVSSSDSCSEASKSFDAFIEKHSKTLNSENEAVHATSLCFDPISHNLFAGTNRGEVLVWSLCDMIAYYYPSLKTTSFVSLGDFLNYKWVNNNKKVKLNNQQQREEDIVGQEKIKLVARKQIHVESKKTQQNQRKVDSLSSSTTTGIVSIDCATLNDGSTVIVTAGETDRRCCVSKLVPQRKSGENKKDESTTFIIEECGDLAYGRPSNNNSSNTKSEEDNVRKDLKPNEGDRSSFVGGEKISNYQFFDQQKENDERKEEDEEEELCCVKHHRLSNQTLVAGLSCHHRHGLAESQTQQQQESDATENKRLERMMMVTSDSDDEGQETKGKSAKTMVLGDFLLGDSDENENTQRPKNQQQKRGRDKPGTKTISTYRVMHPDPEKTAKEEEDRKRELASQSSLERALRKASARSPSPPIATTATATTPTTVQHRAVPRPPKFQSRVGVSSAPGSARRHRTIRSQEEQLAITSRSRSPPNNRNSRPTSSKKTTSGASTRKSSATKSRSATTNDNDDDQEQDDEENVFDEEDEQQQQQQQIDEAAEIDFHDLTPEQLYEQKLHFQHRLREMSRKSRLSDDKIFKMDQRGVEALEQHARELREREAELEKEQQQRNKEEAEVASIAATIATTRDLTREDKDVAPSLPSDLSLNSLMVAAAHERRRLASAQRLPPLFLGPQKERFAKAALDASIKSSSGKSKNYIFGNTNAMAGVVCGDAMMCGVEDRPRAGSQQARPSSSRSSLAQTARTLYATTTLSSDHSPAGVLARFSGLRLGSNVLRPSSARTTATASVDHPKTITEQVKSKLTLHQQQRSVSPPQTAGVSSIGRDGAASTLFARRPTTCSSEKRKLTLSEQRDKKIENYHEELRKCLRWGSGKAHGRPMNREELQRQAMLEYNLGIQ